MKHVGACVVHALQKGQDLKGYEKKFSRPYTKSHDVEDPAQVLCTYPGSR
jgi:hypothetical protein